MKNFFRKILKKDVKNDEAQTSVSPDKAEQQTLAKEKEAMNQENQPNQEHQDSNKTDNALKKMNDNKMEHHPGLLASQEKKDKPDETEINQEEQDAASRKLDENKIEHHSELVDQNKNEGGNLENEQPKIEAVTGVVENEHIDHHPEVPNPDQRLMPDPNLAPVLQSTARDLESALAKDQLTQLLRNQKGRQSLVDQGILGDGSVADTLLLHKKELERHMAGDRVDQELRDRHTKEELTQCGVLKGGVDSLQSVRLSLEQEQKKIALNHKLSDRPTPEQLQAQHILETQESIADKEERRASAAGVMEEQIQKQSQYVKKKNHKNKKPKN